MRSILALLTASIVPFVTSTALAEDCPPGDWFCEEPTENPAADDEDVTVYEPAPASEQPSNKSEEGDEVIIYREKKREKKDKPRRKIVLIDSDAELPPPKPRRRRPPKEWGLNLRVEGSILEENEHTGVSPGLGGLGFSFRYRPVPHFALDAGLDFMGGTDWNGYDRQETILPLTALVFFNPRDVVQVYLPAGINFSWARVEVAPDNAPTVIEQYRYFGAHLGIGLEFRVGKKTALNVDMLGFIRGRTDSLAESKPEFIDPETKLATNTSGGGLLRGGITFYW